MTSLSIDEATMFGDAQGQRSARVEKKQRKWLGRVEPFIGSILEDGETVLRVVPALSPFSMLAALTIGNFYHAVKRCLLVFTDRRIVQVYANYRLMPRSSYAEVRYSHLRSAARRMGVLSLDYTDGSKERFQGISDRKAIDRILADRVGAPGASGRRVHLCPRCASRLTPGVYTCHECRLAFKSKSEGRRLSLLLPGGGYFYTRHPWLGASQALSEGFLIVMLFVIFSIQGDDKLAGIAILVAAVPLLKMLTIYHTDGFVEEFLPSELPVSSPNAPGPLR
jgi:hypothetical protein